MPEKHDNGRLSLKITLTFLGILTLFIFIYVIAPASQSKITVQSEIDFIENSRQVGLFEDGITFTAINPVRQDDNIATRSPLAPADQPIIFMATKHWVNFFPNVAACPVYNNCRIIRGYQTNDPHSMSELREASVVMFQKSFLHDYHSLPHLTWEERSKQLWILKNLESPAYSSNRYPDWVNGQFNITMSYRRDSDLKVGYEKYRLVKRDQPIPPVNYKEGKTKGALAIISNCGSQQYSRLDTVHKLAQYIDIDVYGGCGNHDPCGRMKFDCESKTYSHYHFYLSFENSLCKDYITEKFWARLSSDAHFVPVVIGGINKGEYENAPPNSLINVYDFDTIEHLGLYLKELMANETLYNSFQSWRDSYYYDKTDPVNFLPTCEICRLANKLPKLKADTNLANWWNEACQDHSFN